MLELTEEILERAQQLSTGEAKECSKCGEIKLLSEFKDSNLKSGIGRNCVACKTQSPPSKRSPFTARHTLPKLAKLSAPDCPRCGQTMKMRFRKRDDKPFWGCLKFPYCKGTRNI